MGKIKEKNHLSSEEKYNNASFGEKVCKAVKRKLPILKWFPKYDRESLLGDFIAGITVGTTAVPQVMAYAALAGLTPEYGLYSSFVAPLIYIFLGTCPQVSLGTAAVVSLMTYQTCQEGYPDCVVLAAFYSGFFELILGIFGLGFVVSLISEPASVGFISAVALTVASSQLKNIFGLTHVPRTTTSAKEGLISHLIFVFSNLSEIQYGDTILAFSCISILVFLQNVSSFVKPKGKIMGKTLWLVTQCRNVLVVFTTTLLAYLWTDRPFAIIKTVRGGFPPIGPPKFELPVRPSSVNLTELGLDTLPVMSFGETMQFLGAGPIVIGVVSILQNVAICKAWGNGKTIDGNQEMFALGVANVIGSFFSAQPTTGAFSRAALSRASGVRTPLAGLFTASLVLGALLLITPAFAFIPKAALGAVIMSAVVSMVEYEKVIPLWRLSKSEFLITTFTFLISLYFGMEYGMMSGVTVSIIYLLYNSMTAKLTYELHKEPSTNIDYIYINNSVGLRFPNIDIIRKYISKATLTYPNTQILVIDCTYWTSLDFTAVLGISSIVKSLQTQGKHLILLNLGDQKEQQWKTALINSGGLNESLINCFDGDIFNDGSNSTCSNNINAFGKLLQKLLPEEAQPLSLLTSV